MRKMNSKPMDEEEHDLADAIEDLDTRELHTPTASEQSQFRSAAREYRKAEAKMNIRIDPRELDLIRERAAKEGLKYQTLVKSILHKYVTGQLVERR